MERFVHLITIFLETRISSIDSMYDHPMNTLSFAESDELVDDQREVNRLLKKSMDEISVENRKKRASGENSVDAVLKELGFQLPEGEIRSCTTFFFHKHKLYFKYKHFLQHGMTVEYNNKLLTRQKQYNPVQLYINVPILYLRKKHFL